MMKSFRAAVCIVAAAVLSVPAQAQTVRVRGTIAGIDGNALAIDASDGSAYRVTLADDATVVAVVKASIVEVKEGTFLGSAAVPQPDGTQKALEVHIFPEPMRGTGEGHRSYAPVPSGTMTNGSTSGSMVTGVDGTTIVVRYKDGEKKIVVPPGTPVVRYEIGSRADLKPGAPVTVLAATVKPDGTMAASRINVGRDGTVPQ